MVQKVRSSTTSRGFNALTDKYENLVKAGVIDPTKVVRTALQNAASIASLLLTTEALVSEIPEDKKDAPGGGPGGGMGGMLLSRGRRVFAPASRSNTPGPAGLPAGPFSCPLNL